MQSGSLEEENYYYVPRYGSRGEEGITALVDFLSTRIILL